MRRFIWARLAALLDPGERPLASDREFVEFVAGQMRDAGAISYRMMFGEYAVYCEGKVVALICDNQLFVKPTKAGKAYIGEVVNAPPYAGARPFFLIEEQLEDREWLGELVRRTERELPMPKPRKKKKPSSR
jgi:TfoX/Sxy family transcriptional regulator of competence genes